MDEKPVQFFADFRKGFCSKKDGVQYEDYQYIRNGTASIFLFTEPLAGWRYADAQERRTAQDWAKQIDWLLTKQYPTAKKIVLVMDTSTLIALHPCMPLSHHSMPEILSNDWRFIIHQNTGVGLILRRLSYPLLVANASQIIESLIFLPFEISLNHGLPQETLLRKA